MLMILVLWILHKTPNRLSQCRLGVQLDLCIFGALPPIRHSSNDKCPSVRQNELLRPSSLLHRSPLIYFWLSSGPTPKSFQYFPFFIHCCFAFAAGIFMAWGIGWICVPNCNAAVNCLLFLQHGPHDNSVEFLPYAVLWIHWLPGSTQVFLISLVLPRVSHCLHVLHVLQGMAGSHRRFQFLASILNGFFEFLVLRVNEINSS